MIMMLGVSESDDNGSCCLPKKCRSLRTQQPLDRNNSDADECCEADAKAQQRMVRCVVQPSARLTVNRDRSLLHTDDLVSSVC